MTTCCSADVDLVVNVFERTYRRLTDPQAFAALAASHTGSRSRDACCSSTTSTFSATLSACRAAVAGRRG